MHQKNTITKNPKKGTEIFLSAKKKTTDTSHFFFHNYAPATSSAAKIVAETTSIVIRTRDIIEILRRLRRSRAFYQLHFTSISRA